ncbi:MAG TPA: PfkB family carbohydrate kinase [Ramlibacter sp.]|nr:PfkB family carbohydrate kinase [Ramlibacter sp.]
MVFPESPLPVQVATAGEALIDLIAGPDGLLRPCAGGAVYNLSRALGWQEIGTLYLNPLSADGFGRQLAAGLAEAGVRLARPEPAHQPTSLAVVGLDAQGKASYSFYREGVADRQVRATQLCADCAAPTTLQAVATGCLALAAEDRDKYLPWLRGQRHAGRLVAVDANLRPAVVPDMDAYRASVMRALAEAHLVKVSDDDLKVLGFTEPDPLRAGAALLERIPARWLALTLGPQGAVLLVRDGVSVAAVETEPVPVADTVGAGDCFFGGLLAAMLRLPGVAEASADRLRASTAELQGVLAHAVASASLCVMRTGCAPPTLAQVQARLRTAPPRTRALP